MTRRVRALKRRVRYHARTLARKPVRIHVDIRWRLGDEIMALPIYESIKRAQPRSTLSVSCSYPELLDGNPFVDRVFGAIDADTMRDCDRVIDLRDASRVEKRRSHYARLAGVPVSNEPPRVYWGRDKPAIDMNDSAGPWIAVSSGATWSTKRWSIGRWRDLCAELERRGYSVVQLGHGDKSIGLRHDLVGQTTVREAGAVLRRCALFVGCDSGLLHLASALRIPSIGLFGPTDPAILFGEEARITYIRNGRSCQGCWNGALSMREPGVCPLNVDACLGPIDVDAVIAAVITALDDTAPEERCA